MNLLCLLGRHKWKYKVKWFPVVAVNSDFYREETRTCERCGVTHIDIFEYAPINIEVKGRWQ